MDQYSLKKGNNKILRPENPDVAKKRKTTQNQ